jgi:hypothetical protein
MTVLKELSVVQEIYTDRNGEQKKKWLNIGQLHEHEGREYIVLYPHINLAALPRKEGDSRLFVTMFDPKPRDGAQAAQSAGNDYAKAAGKDAPRKPADSQPEFDNDSDIPF